ncbi:MAG: hypothetical protein ACREI3_06160 [Nitrospirales bacterium]
MLGRHRRPKASSKALLALVYHKCRRQVTLRVERERGPEPLCPPEALC